MEKTMFEMVGEFHKKFGLPIAGGLHFPKLADDEVATFRKCFLREEFNEFCRAQDDGDLVQIADALVDIVYVALGTAHFYGLPFDKLFAEVQRSNMEKVRATSSAQSKRGSEWDVVKPEDWVQPDLWSIIEDEINRFG